MYHALFYVIGAAAYWGLSYALAEKILKTQMSVPTYMLITSVVGIFISLLLFAYNKDSRSDISAIIQTPSLFVGPTFNAVLYAIGSVLIYVAISRYTATSVSLLELTYPFFTAFFAWLIFKDIQLSPLLLAEGAFIVVGVSIIVIGTKSTS